MRRPRSRGIFEFENRNLNKTQLRWLRRVYSDPERTAMKNAYYWFLRHAR